MSSNPTLGLMENGSKSDLNSQNSNFSRTNEINGVDTKMSGPTINTLRQSEASSQQSAVHSTQQQGLSGGPIRPSEKSFVAEQIDSARSHPYLNRSLQAPSGAPTPLSPREEFKSPTALPHLFRSFRATKFCKRCGLGNSIVVYDSKSGSEICTRCGIVVEDRVINEEQEWRSFSNDGNDGNSKSRIGSVNDVWLDDGTDSQLMVGDKKLMKTMLKHNTQASSDRMIKEVFAQLRQIASSFSLHDNIIERCKEIVKEQSNLNILKSGKKNVLAIVYLACREEGVSRTVKELLSFDRTISERELVRSINKLKKDLPRRGPTLSSSAAELMPRFCHYLQLSHEIVGVAEYVCRAAEQYINKSHRPNSLAAGAIYFVCNLCNIKIEMKSVAVAAKSGETTVRGVYKELLLVGDKLLPRDFTPKLVGGIEALKKKSKIFE
ncbi:Transcription initiation factor IIB [Cryptosporidium felis]|nr:Transcription initiation factor IIB [Cryptosporidium felis]